MTSQLRQIFQASQAVHGADDVTTPSFQSQVNSMSICGPQIDTLIYYYRLSCVGFSYKVKCSGMGSALYRSSTGRLFIKEQYLTSKNTVPLPLHCTIQLKPPQLTGRTSICPLINVTRIKLEFQISVSLRRNFLVCICRSRIGPRQVLGLLLKVHERINAAYSQGHISIESF